MNTPPMARASFKTRECETVEAGENVLGLHAAK